MPTDSYKFGAVINKGLSTEDYFKYHNNTVFQNMHKFMMKHGVASASEGLDRVLNG